MRFGVRRAASGARHVACDARRHGLRVGLGMSIDVAVQTGRRGRGSGSKRMSRTRGVLKRYGKTGLALRLPGATTC